MASLHELVARHGLKMGVQTDGGEAETDRDCQAIAAAARAVGRACHVVDLAGYRGPHGDADRLARTIIEIPVHDLLIVTGLRDDGTAASRRHAAMLGMVLEDETRSVVLVGENPALNCGASLAFEVLANRIRVLRELYDDERPEELRPARRARGTGSRRAPR